MEREDRNNIDHHVIPDTGTATALRNLVTCKGAISLLTCEHSASGGGLLMKPPEPRERGPTCLGGVQLPKALGKGAYRVDASIDPLERCLPLTDGCSHASGAAAVAVTPQAAAGGGLALRPPHTLDIHDFGAAVISDSLIEA